MRISHALSLGKTKDRIRELKKLEISTSGRKKIIRGTSGFRKYILRYALDSYIEYIPKSITGRDAYEGIARFLANTEIDNNETEFFTFPDFWNIH
ncbi:MAG: hypothetical protein Q8N88_04795 [Nanoarchaeota archaeon]|nr:hypothetical protein [Nanoarchaeota archaeon]